VPRFEAHLFDQLTETPNYPLVVVASAGVGWEVQFRGDFEREEAK